ncbi:uncharacterized protein LOC135833724 [Planococcus citri]|uniref:uncharacterized protein LOC135833724 n=1 Tax=Planococcus citri TaxID=170843 RepID=UPI0031FA0C5D
MMKSSFLIVSIFAFGPIFTKCNNSTSSAINGTISSTSSNSNSTMKSYETRILLTNTNTDLIAHPTPPRPTTLEELICHNKLFIDNSLLIHYLYLNNRTLIALPLAFGKTTSLQMLKTFFQIEIDETTGERLKPEETKSHKLFVKREITCSNSNQTVNIQDEFLINDGNYSDVLKLMGTKPVIHLDLHVSESPKTIQDVENLLRNRLKNSILEHDYLKHNLSQYEAHRSKYKDLLDHLNSTRISEMSQTLPSLATILADIFNQTVIVLIDDYDAPLNKIFDILTIEKDQKTAISHIKSIYRSLINSSFVQYVFITGTYYWADPELFPESEFALNTVAGGEAINFYGFTENQIEMIFKQTNMEQYLAQVKSYYKAYDFGISEELLKYNPYSITASIANPNQIGSLWISIETTSTITLIKHLVKYTDFNKQLYQVLIGGYIPIQIHPLKKTPTRVLSFTFDDFSKQSSAIKNSSLLDTIEWYSRHNLDSTIGFKTLFATGYLTRVRDTESLHHIDLERTILAKPANLEIKKHLWSQYDSILGISTADTVDRTQELLEASTNFNELLIQLISTNYTNCKHFAIHLKKLMKSYKPLGMQTPGAAVHYNERIIESLIETHILSSVYKLDILSREIRAMFNWINRNRPDVVLITRERRMVIIQFKYGNLATPKEVMDEAKEYAAWYLEKRNERNYGHISDFKLITVIVRRTLKKRIEVDVEILPRKDIENIIVSSTRGQPRWKS